MTKRILVDGVHLDEVRVAVVNDDRLEEFDFENIGKKQIKGNIYLGKVTRVEPSLQAAFVEYGGNRQGFLPFSEIHYGYFHIPVSDKEAIARAEQDDEDAIDSDETEKSKNDEDVDVAEVAAENATDDKGAKDPDVIAADAEDDSAVEVKVDVSSELDAEEKPKKPATRRRKAAPKKEVAEKEATDNADAEEKPKKPATRRRKAAPKKEVAEKEVTDNVDKDASEKVDEGSEKPSAIADAERDAKKKAEYLARKYSEEDWLNDSPEADDAPKKRTSRRKPAAKKNTKDVAEKSEDNTNNEAENEDVVVTKTRHFGGKKSVDLTLSDDVDSQDEAIDGEETDEAEDLGSDEAVGETAYARGNYHKQYKIQEVLKRGQIVLVQVIKEERGNKGASLTTYISLAGRYCVLMPNADRAGGVSRRIDDYKDRQRLKEMVSGFDVPKGMSVIVRTAGIDQEEEEIKGDYTQLTNAWGDITNATMDAEAPALIHEEGSLIKCTLRDMYRSDVDEILVQGDDAFKSASDFMKMVSPEERKKLKKYEGRDPIFRSHSIDKQLDELYNNEAQLPSGGSIVISPTEALVSIDVNSGRATKERSIEDTALSTNLEAANEVARQLRLRDLAGLVVIDFIDMREMRNRRAVERALKTALKRDRAKIQVGRISSFGLMEMSRQRMRSSIVEASFSTCPHCQGIGSVRSNESVAVTLLRAIELESQHRDAKQHMKVRVAAATAEYLLNFKRNEITLIEKEHDITIELAIDHTLFGVEHHFDKRRGGGNSRNQNRSKKPRNDNGKRGGDNRQERKPAADKPSNEVAAKGAVANEKEKVEAQQPDKKPQEGRQDNPRRKNNRNADGRNSDGRNSERNHQDSGGRNNKNRRKNNNDSNRRSQGQKHSGNALPSEKVVDDAIGNRIDEKAERKQKVQEPKEVKNTSNTPENLDGERSKIMDIWKKMTR